jgi:hypothetical protein
MFALTALRSATSKTLKKVLIEPPGGLLGPSERLSMLTPSATACTYPRKKHLGAKLLYNSTKPGSSNPL